MAVSNEITVHQQFLVDCSKVSSIFSTRTLSQLVFFISYITSFENLGGDQDISCLMIISSILITCVVAEMVIR